MNRTQKVWWLCFTQLLAALFLWTSCETTSPSPPPVIDGTNGPSSIELIHVADKISVILSDIPGKPIESDHTIPEDGEITLHLNVKVKASDKTKVQLQNEIHDLYVTNKIYKRITVTVKTEERFFFVIGEVRNPNRFPYFAGEMTVLRAISTAGGFTDFANKKKVQITRLNGKIETVDCVRAQTESKRDVFLYPGERVFVPRRF